jgi:hypothetical protein
MACFRRHPGDAGLPPARPEKKLAQGGFFKYTPWLREPFPTPRVKRSESFAG